ncbi:DeoR/GlpR family DNA-binding transcription regulator [Sporosarcina luteola]|uniref:DeoR/GlpR family DNA-binding transcription regulator n=1 Tax=Sporosarcina luteola TaxID=582850 RepID=UPI00203EF206|nr:DeoR/GlpR family DNA-binding transcription regulator [Sporosarcina luteola]MCM3711696.1 DeoR/GlpR family DNA-binding transcription regulator [Sporosarcina luteola]
MLSSERKMLVIEYINKNGTVTIQELASEFSVSEMTIRRDLEDLDKQNIIKRIYGGAMKIEEPFRIKLPFEERKDQFLEEKRRIGRVAASLVMDRDTILLDSGTTCLETAKHLGDKNNLFAITNSIPNAIELSTNKNCDVFMMGGFIKESNQLNLVGSHAIDILDQFSVDKLFLGAMGIHEKRGLVYYEVEETLIRKKMIEIAKKVYVVIDSSKFGRDGLFSIGSFSSINTIITDDKISEEQIDFVTSKGIKLIIVSENDTESIS